MFNPSSTDDATSFPAELNLLRTQAARSTPARRLNAVKSRYGANLSAPSLTPERMGPLGIVPTQTSDAGSWRPPQPEAEYEGFSSLLDSYAAPLAPMRERDLTALGGLFEREDIHDVETDIIRNLLTRWPEPCWDDDPFEFLQDFL
ncbi:hypothetical protein NDA01_04405 [Trichocoleus desertorum AS-A10]|uniref:hypothetical protein n=1 Tax=Trichocoleus desertorum TaxID=1481672 RepID=UPI0032990316